MHEISFIKDIVIILALSLPVIFLFRKLKLPNIVGFLITGIIIGPYGLQLITSDDFITTMSEVGVMLLLFTIGLEVSIKKLIRLKRLFLIGGGLQLIITALIGFGLFSALGLEYKKAIFYGLLISLSSTAIVLKLLTEKEELEAPHGNLSLGILLFQDLAIVPIILILPLLSDLGDSSVGSILLNLVGVLGLLTVIVAASHYLMPKMLYQFAKFESREAFTIASVLIIFGTAYLVGLIGLSLSLGAFVAGLVLSESDFSYQITSEIIPIRDVFSSIFFVSVGLMLDLTFVADFPLRLLGLSVVIMAIKILVIFGVALLLKNSLRISLIAGLILAQVGEFSFVIAQEGLQYDLIEANFYNAFLAASIFTMVVTPIITLFSPKLTGRIKDIGKSTKAEHTKLKNHVIVVGYGINGRNLTRVLKETGIPYLIIELNPLTVKKCKDAGEPIFFGDSTREEILRKAGIKDANVIVFAIADPQSTILGMKTAKRLNPNIYSIVRTRHVSGIDELKEHGADVVIPEEFETSLEIFKKVLTKYHIPLNVIQQQENLIRTEGYSLFWKQEDAVEHKLTNINRMLAEGLTETYYVDEKNSNVGRSLKEIDLRNNTDATIIAIVNEKETVTNPGAEVQLNPKDTLVLYGTHKSVDEAIDLLDGKLD